MLFTAIAKSRKIGKEIYSAEQIEAQNCIAEANANIEQFLSEQEKITARLDAIKRKAKQIAQDNPNSVELQRLQIKYAELNKELKRVEQNLNLWVTQYNNTVSQLKVMEDGQAYTEISATDLQTPAEFSKKVQAVSAQLDRIVTNQQGIADLAGEYEAGKDEGVRSVASSDDGGFMDAINSSDDVNTDIFGATTTARNVDGATNNAPKTANWFD
jgi:seryl-tRNA synthetase